MKADGGDARDDEGTLVAPGEQLLEEIRSTIPGVHGPDGEGPHPDYEHSVECHRRGGLGVPTHVDTFRNDDIGEDERPWSHSKTICSMTAIPAGFQPTTDSRGRTSPPAEEAAGESVESMRESSVSPSRVPGR